jgi:1,4-dihydroxy-2-naphthoyl-CoA hydrolase
VPFIYQRTVRFQDTDAAGVVYFANVLSLCHEAYEASLIAAGIELRTFFRNPDLAIPITHANVNFFHPLVCGDRLNVHLIPNLTSDTGFEISYAIYLESRQERSASTAQTRHVCIQPETRTHQSLPADIHQWLQRWAA